MSRTTFTRPSVMAFVGIAAISTVIVTANSAFRSVHAGSRQTLSDAIPAARLDPVLPLAVSERTGDLQPSPREHSSDARLDDGALKDKDIIALCNVVVAVVAGIALLAVGVLTYRSSRMRIRIAESLQGSESRREFEEERRRFFTMSPELHCVMGMDGKLLTVNPAFERVLEFPLDQLGTKSLLDLVHPEDSGTAHNRIESAAQGNGVGRVDIRCRLRSGTYVWLAWSFAPDAVRQRIYATASNVTQQKKAENALRRSEENFRFIAEKASDIITRRGLDGVYHYVSPRCIEFLGYEPHEMIGKSPRDFCHPEDIDAVMQLQQGAFAQDGVVSAEYRFRCKDGQYLWLEVTGYALRDPQTGEPTEIMAASRDVTTRKQREYEIQRLNQMLREKAIALEAVNSELEAFSYSVSHDLRAPLRSMDGFSHALLEDYEDRLDESGKDFLQRIRAATQRMGTMIDSLLSLSRLTRKELNLSTVDLSALARDAAEELQRSDPSRKVEWNLAPDLFDSADSQLMRHVFQNLLGNAWKYTRDCSEAKIEFSVTDSDGDRAYFVRDNGAGFDEKYSSKLFGAFQRLHNVEEFEGVGVGLATVKRIIQRFGGRVWAEGHVGRGATFYFTLDCGGKA